MVYYPLFLDLRNQNVTVIGGGAVAAEKVRGLLDAGATIRLIAERAEPVLWQLSEAGALSHLTRDYQAGDLAGASIVIAERGEPATNEAIWREAIERGIPINVVDDLPHCTFIAPAVLRQGDLTIAISTAGKAPALAVRLRQRFERWIGPQYARFLEIAGALRPLIAARHPAFEERRLIWYRLVDSNVIDLLRRGAEDEARATIEKIVGLSPEEIP
ncbi:MAG TPA: bifunctional precorrin-2 dehydrogenase/sirohydrochlorin ferrochelatase [Acidobacteriota bacterium]